jgi:tripartite-type tricarboxylate transporter receptor subunit TctC
VNFAPGGTVDIVARMIGQKLSESLGQPVVVENRVGASGNIGADVVAKAPADGYTLLMTNGATLMTNPHLYKNMTFDPMRDFTPIAEVARTSPMLVVRPSLPANSAAEFIAYLKAHPDKLSFGSAGNGSGPHLTGEMLNRLAGVKAVHVPYKGLGPALADLVAGQIDFIFADGAANSYIQSGKVKLLAVASSQRVALFPQAPTMLESGVAGFQYDAAHALVAPTGTPRDIIVKLNREVVKILRTPEIKERIDATVGDVIGNSPEEFAANLKANHERIGRLIREIGIRGD